MIKLVIIAFPRISSYVLSIAPTLQANFLDWIRNFDCIYTGAAFGYNLYWEFIGFLFSAFGINVIILIIYTIKFFKRIRSAKKNKYMILPIVSWLLVSTIAGTLITTTFYFSRSSQWIIKKFEQAATILDECATDKEKENLRADFKKMTDRNAYKLLYDKIDIYWKKYEIKFELPKSKLERWKISKLKER